MSDQDKTQLTKDVSEQGELSSEERRLAQRRAFLGRSGKIMLYTPPLIQLFIPTKAAAASPSVS